jgi:hypothetical protein
MSEKYELSLKKTFTKSMWTNHLTDKKIKHDSEVYISWTFLELEFKLAILKNKCT